MATHTVQEGEGLIRIAHAHGFKDWRTIYHDDANAGLRTSRPDPMQLVPGDVVHLPEKVAPQLACTTGQTYVFRLQPLERPCLRLQLHAGAAPWVLLLGGEEVARGTATPEGLIEVPVPADMQGGELRLWEGVEGVEPVVLALEPGLQPVGEVAGVVARLGNLGYLLVQDAAAEPDEEAVRAAVRTFQADHGLEVTGRVDDGTRRALAAAHE